MTSSDDHSELVPEDLYYQATSDHMQLQERLPEEAVVSFAREVINRLARQAKSLEAAPEDVRDIASDLVAKDAEAAAARVRKHLAAGVSAKALYHPYLGNASRMMGERWERDEITFAELTVGIGRIYGIMRSLRPHIKPTQLPGTKSAIFASVPGDDHTLGVRMAADMARKDGWEVDLKTDRDHDTLVDEIAHSGELLLGISGAGEHSLPNLAKLVVALRISAPEALIMVSGNIADVDRESVELMHVDGIATKYEGAMQMLDDLWHQLQETNPT